MSTIYMSQLSALPLMEGDQDHPAGHFPAAFHLAKDPPILFPFMIDSPAELHAQGVHGGEQQLGHQFLTESSQQLNYDHMMMAGGSDVFTAPSPFRPTVESVGGSATISYDRPYDVERKRAAAINGSTSCKWASSGAATTPAKMRITRKATTTNGLEGGAVTKPRRRAQAHQEGDANHYQQHQQHAAVGVIKVCSDCNTTKTPLWRSGPCGPKSLCNACGIRQRKARQAMAAAATATAANGSQAAVSGAPPQAVKQAKKEKRAATNDDRSLPFKKRCKAMVDHAGVSAANEPGGGVAAQKKDHHDHDHAVGGEADAAAAAKTGTPAAFFHGFPRDEITDAAMLLMTLSCGLVSG